MAVYPVYNVFDCSHIITGDPDAIARVSGKEDINYLNDWASSQNLQLLNLT